MRRATQCLTQKARFEHARYSLKEPKRDVQELYVKKMKQSIARDRGLVRKLTRAFASCQKELADKLKPRTLPHAVASIAARRVLTVVLKRRREGAGEFLKCVRKLQVLHLLTEDVFAQQYHTPSSEPYFYDQSYAQVKRTAPIPVDDNGKCIVGEVLKRIEETGKATKWMCTAECKLPDADAREKINALVSDFEEKIIPELRQALDEIDTGCPYLHHRTPFTCKWEEGVRRYSQECTRPLRGHPLPCALEDSECPSLLRMLRAATPHFPRLHEMLKPLYGAISNNKFITRIDKALSEGDFVGLCLWLNLSEYANLLGPSNQSAFLYSPLDSSSGPQFQEPNLPDLLQVEHAELIKVFRKEIGGRSRVSMLQLRAAAPEKAGDGSKVQRQEVLFGHLEDTETPCV